MYLVVENHVPRSFKNIKFTYCKEGYVIKRFWSREPDVGGIGINLRFFCLRKPGSIIRR